jgi:hypothetical protein
MIAHGTFEGKKVGIDDKPGKSSCKLASTYLVFPGPYEASRDLAEGRVIVSIEAKQKIHSAVAVRLKSHEASPG